MKVFWSWQSDTPGKIGRHFVRDALKDAIALLKQPEDVEEPTERETREALHLDHDRQGVSGSPDLAPTIFRKIEQAGVFIADVTLVGEASRAPEATKSGHAKKLINPNVAIEYGYALHALGDEFILMVQNAHFGEREELPFDLKHKAGPLQFRLAPSPAPRLNETPRKRTISAMEVCDGGSRGKPGATGRRGATARVWRSGARSRRPDVAATQDVGGAATASGRGSGDGVALARRHRGDADELA